MKEYMTSPNTLSPSPQKIAFNANICRILAMTVSLLGVVVIVGWYLNILPLLQIHPAFALMVYNTALGFVLSGVASLLLFTGQKRFAFALGSLVLLLGSLTAWQFISGQDLPIDQLFKQQFILDTKAHPGRMSLPTALCFTLTGTFLLAHCLAFPPKTKTALSEVIVPAIIALPFTSVFSYLFGFEIPYGWGNLAGMALHTSVGFVVLGIAFILWVFNQPSPINYLPSVAVTLLILLFALWASMGTQTTLAVREKAELRNQQIKTTWLEQAESENAAWLRMASRINRHESQLNWQNEAALYMHDFHYITLIYFEPERKQVFTASGSNAALTEELLTTFDTSHCSYPAQPSTALWHSAHYSGELLIKTMPTEKGCLMAAKDFLQKLNNARKVAIHEHFPLKVLKNNKPLYQEASDGDWFVETTLSFQGLEFILQLTPTRKQLTPGNFPKILTAAGLAISVLLLLSLYLAGAARRKSRESTQLLIALKQQEATAKQVIEMAPNAMIMVNKHGLIELINAQGEAIFGYLRSELIGQSIDILLPERFRAQHPQHRASFFSNPSSRAMGLGRELFACRKDGSELPVEIGLAPIATANGLKVLAAVVDISERKHNEQKQTEFSNELARINAELNSFTYIASHDLKAPLRGIDQLATWISEDMGDNLSSETQEHLRLMRSRIKRMEMLLDDLLAYSRVGRTQDDVTEVNTHSLLEDIFDLTATQKPIKLILADNLPTLNTQKVPLELVFRNLMSNAIKHHDKAQGSITISSKPTINGIEFTVADDGPGIPLAHQERVFDMFQTLKPRDEVEGSGMGLAIVKKAVESVGGSITLESNGFLGCAFRFTWPTKNSL
jgi:PAS domain S-box-containing protein